MILITRCYSETTPESAEEGDNSDSGVIVENVEYGFRELVTLLKDHQESSCYPSTGDTFEWYSTGYQAEDFETMTEREETVHFSRENKPHNARYWRLAAIAAGIAKRA